MDVLTFETCGK